MQNNSSQPRKGGVKIGDLKKRLEAKKNPKKATPTKDALLKPDTPIVKAKKATVEAIKNNVPSSLKDTPPVKGKPRKEATDVRKLADNSNTELDLDGLHKPSTYLMFCDWIAQPEGMRNPINQKAFAQMYKVDEDTLTKWKQRKGFWAVVDKRVKAQWREKTGLAMQALFTTILRKGSAKEVQLFLQYAVGFNPRIVIEEEVPDLQKYDPASLATMAEAMKNAGLAGVTEEHKKLEQVFNDLALSDEDEDETYDHTDES
jgi:hypothetical protein